MVDIGIQYNYEKDGGVNSLVTFFSYCIANITKIPKKLEKKKITMIIVFSIYFSSDAKTSNYKAVKKKIYSMYNCIYQIFSLSAIL